MSTPGRPLGQVLRDQLKANPANRSILSQALPTIVALEQSRHVDIRDMHPAVQALFHPAIQDFLINAFAYDPRDLLAGLSKPVLIVQGQRDIQVGEQDARLLQQANSQAKLILLSDVNHFLKAVHSQDPQDNMETYSNSDLPLASGVVKAIADFLASNSSTAKN